MIEFSGMTFGEEYWINPRYVVSVVAFSPNRDYPDNTKITMEGGQSYVVRANVEQVMLKIQAAKAKAEVAS